MNTIIVPIEELEKDHTIAISGFILDKFILRIVGENQEISDAFISFENETDWINGTISVLPILWDKKGTEFKLKVVYHVKIDSKSGTPEAYVADLNGNLQPEELKMYVKKGHSYGTEIVCALMAIMEKIENRKKKIVEVDRKNRSERKNKCSSSDSKKEASKIFLLDEFAEYVAKNNLSAPHSNHNIITCPCWSVRGHYRTYKSGKKVFVRPFQKGKERGKTAPKEHIYVV